MIFCFNDYRMKNPDNDERYDAENYACEVH